LRNLEAARSNRALATKTFQGEKPLKFRRAWWELHDGAKEYCEEQHKKWTSIKDKNPDLAWEILRLPRGFTCFHFDKTMTIEDRHHLGLILALARPRGALEYDMLEIEHHILRKVPRN